MIRKCIPAKRLLTPEAEFQMEAHRAEKDE